MQDLKDQPQIVREISSCINEDGEIEDSASDDLRTARGKLRAVEGRLKGLLKGHSGEISVMVSHAQSCIVFQSCTTFINMSFNRKGALVFLRKSTYGEQAQQSKC